MKRLLWIVGLISAAGIARGADDEKKFHPVDLQPQANQKRADSLGSGVEGNNLAKVPGGEQKFGDVKFKVEAGMLHLGSNILDRHPDKVLGIKVDGKCAHLHILHGTCFGGGPNKEGSPLFVKDGTLIGEYRINYEDKSAVNVPIVYGQDVRDWFYVPDEAAPVRGKIVWSGENDRATEVGAKIRLYLTTWKNPKPDQKIVSIDYLGKKEDTAAAPFCLAITREE